LLHQYLGKYWSLSLINDICTNSRNRLSQNSLDAIMHIVKERKETLTDNVLDKLVEIYCPRAMRLMTLIKLIVMKLFMLLTHYQSLTLVLIHSVPQKLNTL
jgi:hypothetical protein